MHLRLNALSPRLLGTFGATACAVVTMLCLSPSALAQDTVDEPKDLQIDTEADGTEPPADVTDGPPPNGRGDDKARTTPKPKPQPTTKPMPTPTASIAAPPAAPAPPALTDPNAQLAFADHLFLDGDYYRSISEYRRFLYMVRGRGTEAPRAAMAIGEALMRGEQWDAAGRQLDGVAQRTRDPGLRQSALFGAARAYLLDGRPELAKPRFRLLAQDDNTPQDLKEESTWLLAWGHFDAGELSIAKETFALLAAEQGRHQASAQDILSALDAFDGLPSKDPLIAGALSLFPGGGHFYLGQWVTGVTSLVWNSLFLIACVQAFINGDIGIGLVLTVFEIGWYGGGIFGAVAGANRYNRDAVRNWRDDILATHGQSRDLPDEHLFRRRADAKPGSLLRFGGRF